MKNTINIFLLCIILIFPAAGQYIGSSGSTIPAVKLVSSAKLGDDLFIGGDMGMLIRLNTEGDLTVQEKGNSLDELSRLSMIQSINEYGLAVGTGGAVFKYEENTWNRLQFDYKSSLRAIYSLDEDKTIITAAEGKFYLSEDGGNTWTEKQTTFPYSINCAIKTGTEVLLCGSNGLIISSEDFFETFSASINIVPGNILSINKPDIDKEEYLLFTQQGRIINWNRQDSSYSMVFQDPEFTFTDWAQNGDTILATASEKSILLSANKGLSWEVINHDFNIFIYSVEYYNGQFILTGEKGNIISYKNNEFERITPHTNYDFHCAAPFNNKIFAGTYNGLVLATSDEGSSWTEKISLPDEVITGIVTDGASNLIFSTSEGHMYIYDIETDGFTEFETGIPGNGFQGLFFTGGNYYAITLKGNIYRSSDSETWQLNYQTPDSTVLFDLSIDEKSGLGFAVGDRGKVVMTDDNGITWNDAGANVSFPLLSVIHVKDTWFLAGMYGTLIYTSDALEWTTDLSTTPDGISLNNMSINPLDSFILATSIDGKIMMTEDLAQTWDTLSYPYSLMTSIIWTDNNTAFAFGHNSSVYTFYFDPVSTISNRETDGFLIYPVPARDIMVVEVLNTDIRIDHFKITDVKGRLLQTSPTSFKSRFEINISELNTGMYLLILESGKRIYSQRFIVD